MIAADYNSLVSDAAGIPLATEAAINDTEPNTVPALILSQLAQLEAVTDRLKQAAPPNDAAYAHHALIDGLETFQNDLMDVSDEASRSLSHSWSNTAPRQRCELSLSRGLATIKTALATLRVAGRTDSGI